MDGRFAATKYHAGNSVVDEGLFGLLKILNAAYESCFRESQFLINNDFN